MNIQNNTAEWNKTELELKASKQEMKLNRDKVFHLGL